MNVWLEGSCGDALMAMLRASLPLWEEFLSSKNLFRTSPYPLCECGSPSALNLINKRPRGVAAPARPPLASVFALFFLLRSPSVRAQRCSHPLFVFSSCSCNAPSALASFSPSLALSSKLAPASQSTRLSFIPSMVTPLDVTLVAVPVIALFGLITAVLILNWFHTRQEDRQIHPPMETPPARQEQDVESAVGIQAPFDEEIVTHYQALLLDF